MALVGQVGEYVNGTEDITSYIEREADYKVATFLAFIVADAYVVLRNFLGPERPIYISFVQ